MTLDTALQHESEARRALNHAMDRFEQADSAAARARHMRRIHVAHDRVERARYCIRALSAEIVQRGDGV